MAARRNKYKSDFKAQVALEALTGEKTTQELAQIYKTHPSITIPTCYLIAIP
jgi:transposase-like protein